MTQHEKKDTDTLALAGLGLLLLLNLRKKPATLGDGTLPDVDGSTPSARLNATAPPPPSAPTASEPFASDAFTFTAPASEPWAPENPYRAPAPPTDYFTVPDAPLFFEPAPPTYYFGPTPSPEYLGPAPEVARPPLTAPQTFPDAPAPAPDFTYRPAPTLDLITRPVHDAPLLGPSIEAPRPPLLFEPAPVFSLAPPAPAALETPHLTTTAEAPRLSAGLAPALTEPSVVAFRSAEPALISGSFLETVQAARAEAPPARPVEEVRALRWYEIVTDTPPKLAEAMRASGAEPPRNVVVNPLDVAKTTINTLDRSAAVGVADDLVRAAGKAAVLVAVADVGLHTAVDGPTKESALYAADVGLWFTAPPVAGLLAVSGRAGPSVIQYDGTNAADFIADTRPGEYAAAAREGAVLAAIKSEPGFVEPPMLPQNPNVGIGVPAAPVITPTPQPGEPGSVWTTYPTGGFLGRVGHAVSPAGYVPPVAPIPESIRAPIGPVAPATPSYGNGLIGPAPPPAAPARNVVMMPLDDGRVRLVIDGQIIGLFTQKDAAAALAATESPAPVEAPRYSGSAAAVVQASPPPANAPLQPTTPAPTPEAVTIKAATFTTNALAAYAANPTTYHGGF